MSDLLVKLGGNIAGASLVAACNRPFASGRQGESRDFAWGSLAAVREPMTRLNNVVLGPDWMLAWVGDLVEPSAPDRARKLEDTTFRIVHELGDRQFRPELACEGLNGAFAIAYADPTNLVILTDIMGFIQVFCGVDRTGRIDALGTSSDLVASISREARDLDEVSVGEFLGFGTTSFPHTMYKGLRELEPGSIHWWRFERQEIRYERLAYWEPPGPGSETASYEQMVDRLRAAIVEAVRKRCESGKTGVFLSGGLDSRLIMSCVPGDVDCVGITLSDVENRETRTAKRVADRYGRDWRLLLRDDDYLAHSIAAVVRLCGCDFDWINAHAVGFADAISEEGCAAILNGTEFDAYFKGHFAREWVRVPRMRGLLGASYARQGFDYVEQLDRFCIDNLRPGVLDGIRERRIRHQKFVESKLGGEQVSREWLRLYPFSANKIGACLSAERRVLPVRLVAADRRLVEFAMACPLEWKLGGKIFESAASTLWGPGARIPSANDGVTPGSGHSRRLMQRTWRKSADRLSQWRQRLTGGAMPQHSWSNYQEYWRESSKLRRLVQQYEKRLTFLDDAEVTLQARRLAADPETSWEHGFRLIQLAVWMAEIDSADRPS